MKQRILVFALIAPVAIPALAGQNAVADLEALSHAVEVSRLCEALTKAGGNDPRCARASSKATQDGVTAPPAVVAPPDLPTPARRKKAPPPLPDIDVVAYVQNADNVYVDVLFDKQYRRMRIGERVKAWRLNSITDYEATFVDVTGAAEPITIAFRSLPAPTAAQPALGTSPTLPGSIGAPMAPLPAGAPPMPGQLR